MTREVSAELPEQRRLVTAREFARCVSQSGVTPGRLCGLAGSAGVFAALTLSHRLSRSVWYVVADGEAALVAAADAEFYQALLWPLTQDGAADANLEREPIGVAPTQPAAAVILPDDDPPWAAVHPDRRAAMQRLATLSRLALGQTPRLVITSASGLLRRVLPKALLAEKSCVIRFGDQLNLEELVMRAADLGYLRVPLVEDPGTIAVRGGLFDIWSPGAESPCRIELDGDHVQRMRAFDPEAQHTGQKLAEYAIVPVHECVLSDTVEIEVKRRIGALADAIDWPSKLTKALIDQLLEGRPFIGSTEYLPAFCDPVSVLEYLDEDTPIVVEDAVQVLRDLRAAEADLRRSAAAAGKGPHFPFEAWAYDEAQVAELLVTHPIWSLLYIAQSGNRSLSPLDFLEQADANTASLGANNHAELTRRVAAARKDSGANGALSPLVSQIHTWQDAGFEICIVARAETQLDRMAQLLQHRGLGVVRDPALPCRGRDGAMRSRLLLGSLRRGVVLPAEQRVYVTEEEIFGQRSHRREKRERPTEAAVEDLRHLSPGDYVVHVDHGVGRYIGLERREVGGTAVELICIEYQAGKLYLPIYRLNQIAKYSGGEAQPKLDRLGGLSFAKTKARVQQRVRQMADELLHLYSERLVTEKTPIPERDDDYAAFEATFPFEETRDQSLAIADVLGDLESKKVMDRLVCGDVGFGKTEVALRAAFRVAMSGRQVALLCPTTVLAQQHAETFGARLSDWGIELRTLSRFTGAAATRDTLLGLKRGTVDIVVGTHRLLSKDVDFKQLGLLIVDEEQRFGVAHKERIKQLRGRVDVLTLSATPIPRTLQLAVGGLRDLSMISTPPVDRRAIRTIIAKPEADVLVDAITRELDRGGQVFYVHNRVAGLEERVARLGQLFPGVPLVVAHGQMPGTELERRMLRFVEGGAKILVSTAIIENGLDIPRANTLIVDRADLFGLSQLYQLRGRVGRSKERAYCYLLVPSLSELGDEARARLETIERFTELGSGLKVAALDLEQRGAGDFLGAEQSGFMASVGFDLFCHMLRDAAAELQGSEVRAEVEPELAFDVEALLPEDYVADVGVRLSLYKRLSSARDAAEVDEIAWSMEDRFGPAPSVAQHLVQLMRQKTALRRYSILACEASSEQVRLRVREDTALDPARIGRLVSDPQSGYKLLPDSSIVARRRSGETAEHGLMLLARVLDELERCLAASES
jgi:transcription-repair coupling factor (superfamily II helicase)